MSVQIYFFFFKQTKIKPQIHIFIPLLAGWATKSSSSVGQALFSTYLCKSTLHPAPFMPHPLISIILTVHNRADRVAESLRSLLVQTYRPLEIIVVDNASSDDSKKMCQATVQHWQTEHPDSELSIQLLDEMQRGASAARNCGLRAAHGQWVAFFDDDDTMSPDFAAEMLRAAHKKPNARWVVARTRMVFGDGRERVRDGWPSPTLTDHILGSLISTQSFMTQRDLLLHIGGWNAALPCWNDYEIGVRLLLNEAPPAWCQGVFHRIYQHADSITGEALVDKLPKIAQTLNSISRTLNTHAAPHAAHVALAYRCAIVCGQLQCTAAPELAQQLHAATSPLRAPLSPLQRGLACAFRWLSAQGIRGVWRAARWCLPND